MSRLLEGESIPVVSNIFHFTLVYNTGIAFGLFSDHRNLLILLISVSIIILVLLSISLAGSRMLSRVGFALIMGGAIGNWIDRIRYQAVIDFLDFRIWPVFNLADTAITVGVVLYLWVVLTDSIAKKKHHSDIKTS